MKATIYLLLLFICATGWAQKTANAKAEWDQLDKTFVAFIDALQKKDKAAFLALSRTEVDCQDCINSTESESDGYFVPAQTFFDKIAANFNESPVFKAMASRGYAFRLAEINNSKYKKLRIYEVWVDTYLRDEWAKGHEGTSHIFQFVKINGQFKFYGLTSVP